MTRKNLAIFIITFVVSLVLLYVCVGERGIFYMRAMQKRANELSYRKAELQAQVDALEEQSRQLSQGEGLKDAAYRLGYRTEGEQVYVFKGEEHAAKSTTAEPDVPEEITYFHLPLWALSLMALFISCCIVLLYAKHTQAGDRKQNG